MASRRVSAKQRLALAVETHEEWRRGIFDNDEYNALFYHAVNGDLEPKAKDVKNAATSESTD